MSAIKLKVLLVEDSVSLATLYREYLRQDKFDITHVENGEAASNQLEQNSFDVVLLDLKLPDVSGLDILRRMLEKSIPTTTIVLTAHGSIDAAVDAMRYGAFDFLVKPIDHEDLAVTLRNAIEQRRPKLEALCKLVDQHAIEKVVV